MKNCFIYKQYIIRPYFVKGKLNIKCRHMIYMTDKNKTLKLITYNYSIRLLSALLKVRFTNELYEIFLFLLSLHTFLNELIPT